jgi:hypothetical protein
MSSTLLILLLGIGVFLICRFLYKKYKHNQITKVYESENPIDTRGFSFDKAVEGCCVAIDQILQLDKEIETIFTKIETKKKNASGKFGDMLNRFLKSDVYKENNNYPESEKNRKYRIYHRKILVGATLIAFIPMILMILSMILSSMGGRNSQFMNIFAFWIILIVVGYMVYAVYLTVTLPREIKREFKLFPWRFNVLPLGSQMYILREQWFGAFEKTHRLYYDLYLPCKRKADELIVDNKNRTSEHYKAYQELSLYESDIYNCTPIIRIRKHDKEIRRKQAQVYGAVLGIVAITGAAVFLSALSNAGKDLGKYSKSGTRYLNSDTGNLYDESGNRVPW